MIKTMPFILGLVLSVSPVFSQTKADYDQSSSDSSKTKGLFDPSHFTVSHSMNFGMLSGGGYSSVQSQSFYSTMLQYRFAAPVTLNLNFSLPIYSTFSPYQNLTTQNMQSLNYFKNIPFDVSLSWKPSERFHFNLSIVNYPAYNGYGMGMYEGGFMPWNRP
ncbi:MAG: hypothetical protein ABSF80_03355 [Chitinispirillaceae bacterium]|jgi:hypothetical protein